MEMPKNKRFINLSGKTIGLWVVISYAGKRGKNASWLCRCKCGAEKLVFSGRLLHANNPGCSKCKHKRPSIWQTKEYRIWKGMKRRCYNNSHPEYKSYGGRGISICEYWKTSFLTFYADMGPMPSPDHSIDRINNDGNYEPGNCRWATRAEQMSNTQKTVLLTVDGETHTMSQWSRITGLSRQLISLRLKLGWSHKQAVTLKPDNGNGWKRPRAT